MFAQIQKDRSSFGMVGIAVVMGLYLLVAAFIVAVTVQSRARHDLANKQRVSSAITYVAPVQHAG